MHFGENQLSRSLIGLSPLTTGHPPGFQPWWVRSSTRSYLRFNLPMARSLRFGSRACDSNALFRLAFATAPPHGLTSPHTITRRLILQKARSHITNKASLVTLLRLVGTRFQVLFHSPPAVLFTFPSRYCPLSVTREYLGLPGGPGRFTQDFSGPVLLGIPSNSRQDFSYGALTLYAAPSQVLRLPQRFLTVSTRPADPIKRVPQPRTRNPCRLSHAYGLASSGFAHHYSRNHWLFSLPTGTEMFHFPAFPPTALYIQAEATPHDGCWVSPFGHPRIKVWLTTPRGLSQPPTSFIGSWCQGIHRVPLKTWPQRCSRPLCNSQTTNSNQPTPTTRHPHPTKHDEPM